MSSEAAPVVLSSHLVHRALCVSPTDASLRGGPNSLLMDLLYFSAFLEAFVLHEHLVIPNRPNIDEDYFLSTGESRPDPHDAFDPRRRFSGSPVFAPILESGAISFEVFESESDEAALYEVWQEYGSDDAELNYYEAEQIADILFARSRGSSFVADRSRETQTALQLLGTAEARTISQLETLYGRISRSLEADVRRLANARRSSILYLPPIPTIVLERAGRDIEQVGGVAVEVRQEFAGLRAAVATYESDIRNPDLPIGKSIEALDRLTAMGKLLAPDAGESSSSTLREWRDLADVQKLIDGIDVSDTATLTKALLGKPADFLVRKMQLRRVSYLARVRNNFLSVRNYGRLAEDTFGERISSAYVEKARAEGFDVDTLD